MSKLKPGYPKLPKFITPVEVITIAGDMRGEYKSLGKKERLRFLTIISLIDQPGIRQRLFWLLGICNK